MIRTGGLESVYEEADEKVLGCYLFKIGLAKIYKKKKLDDCKRMMIQACKDLYQAKLKLKIVYFCLRNCFALRLLFQRKKTRNH